MTSTLYASHGLSQAEISRYSRQLLVPELGPNGQAKLSKSSALVVGAGGLGCPVAQYLAAAGIGKLGIVDDDVIETNNLHRQVLHQEAHVGQSKAQSIKAALGRLNSNVQCVAHECQFSSANAAALLKDYDLLLDCSDNAPTRYLANDIAILAGKWLVSGSALRWDGQITVYGYKQGNGPCYRCVFPSPPPLNAVTNCSEGGVVGPIVGLIGSLQALEALKLLAGIKPAFAGRMFVYDGLDGTTRTVGLGQRKASCAVCGDRPSITAPIDYETFCGVRACDKVSVLNVLDTKDRIKCEDIAKSDHDLLIDTRPEHEFAIGCLPGAVNIPFEKMQTMDDLKLKKQLEQYQDKEVLVICRRGNDSQLVVQLLRQRLGLTKVRDVIGGLTAFAKKVDKEFPIY